jgi:lipopolysaccharide transport system permease protein
MSGEIVYPMMYRTVISAKQPWYRIDWKELLEYQDLLWLLVKRDLTAIYKQTILGPLWVIIQPLVTTIVFTVIFGKIANISTDGIPQFIFYMSGTILWNYFQGTMNQCANSLIAENNVLSKVYFPRLVIPFSAIFTNLAHFLVNLLMFLGFFSYYYFFSSVSFGPRITLVFFPLLVLHSALLGLGVGLWVAALTTKYRDLRFALPFLTQLWMYATPIVYPASLLVSPKWRLLLWSNPMSFIIECVRWMFTGRGTVTAESAAISIGMTLLLLISGLFTFNKVQRSYVDTI